MTYTATADLVEHFWIQRRWSAFLEAQLDITYACADCGDPVRPIEIQGRLGDGSWRTLKTQTYQGSETLKVRVPYRFNAVRVTAPELQFDASTTYAPVLSNSLPVPASASS